MSKSPSLRRIKADIRELSVDPSDQYYAAPLESDMFEWHFTIRGPADSEFAGGIYHGKILLPPEYPFKPPNIVFLTPSGRFETNVKVCLSFSAHHPELWQPAWGIRLILEAIISFLPTPADGAIGALDWTKEERAKLAKESVNFHCPVCCAAGQSCAQLLPDLKQKSDSDGNEKKSKFQEEIEKLKMLQGMHHAKEEEGEESVENKEKEEETEQPDSTTDETSQLLPSSTEEVVSNTSASESQETQPKPDEATDNAKPAPLPDQNPPEPSDVNPTPVQSAPDNAAESTSTTQTQQVTNETARAPAGNQTNATTAPPAVDIPQHNILVTEPFLNGMIFAFSVTLMYLLTEAKSLIEELNELRS